MVLGFQSLIEAEIVPSFGGQWRIGEILNQLFKVLLGQFIIPAPVSIVGIYLAEGVKGQVGRRLGLTFQENLPALLDNSVVEAGSQIVAVL